MSIHEDRAARREENRRRWAEMRLGTSPTISPKHSAIEAGTDCKPPAWMDKVFPDMPVDMTAEEVKALPTAERWSRYFQAWDVSCGVQTIACLFGGFTREEADAAIAGDVSLQKMKSDTDYKIADRMKMVLHMHIGAMRKHPSLGRERVSENLLGQTIKAMNRELYGDAGEGSFTVSLNVPRPASKGTNLPPAQISPTGSPPSPRVGQAASDLQVKNDLEGL